MRLKKILFISLILVSFFIFRNDFCMAVEYDLSEYVNNDDEVVSYPQHSEDLASSSSYTDSESYTNYNYTDDTNDYNNDNTISIDSYSNDTSNFLNADYSDIE